MLFHFGKFWKTLFFILGAWGFYLIFDFELTAVTLLALIYANKFESNLTVF